MFVFWAMLFGAFIGWAASVLNHIDSNEGILIHTAAGILGAIPMAALLGNESSFDSLLAGGLGAMIAVALLALVRSRLRTP